MLVSILIPNYNYGAFVERCVDSALAQTWRDIEVIVYDDGSTDNSVARLQAYAGQIELVLAKNHGHGHANNQVNAINQAYARARGDIICLLDSDDEFERGKVEHVVSIFQAHPDVMAVEHAGVHVDAAGNVQGVRRRVAPLAQVEGRVDRAQMLGISQRQGFPFAGLPTSFLSFRRSYLERVMPMAEDAFDACFVDGRLSSMVQLHGAYYVSAEPLTRYRVHGNNNFHGRSPARFLRCMQQTCEFYNAAALRAGQRPIRHRLGPTMRAMYAFALRWQLREWRRRWLPTRPPRGGL